jgi:hypothetical protein
MSAVGGLRAAGLELQGGLAQAGKKGKEKTREERKDAPGGGLLRDRVVYTRD